MSTRPLNRTSRPVRVLIVDDSALVRRILGRTLDTARGIEVVGTAADPYAARDMIVELDPDVVTLDVEMPRMDGVTFLRRLMRFRPLPVIVVSSLTPSGSALALEALDAGAIDVLPKPGPSYGVGELAEQLAERIRFASEVRLDSATRARRPQRIAPLVTPTRHVIAVGASIGGTKALQQVLMSLPPNAPGLVVAQHMPEQFTASFADRMNEICDLDVREARTGDRVLPGTALIAPGDKHLVLRRSGKSSYVVQVSSGPLVSGHRPSVDVLFGSVARYAGVDAIGVLLTGMGSDGARGLLNLRHAGAPTLAQDEGSSVVFGMAREAVALGAVDQLVPLERIASAMMILSERDTHE